MPFDKDPSRTPKEIELPEALNTLIPVSEHRWTKEEWDKINEYLALPNKVVELGSREHEENALAWVFEEGLHHPHTDVQCLAARIVEHSQELSEEAGEEDILTEIMNANGTKEAVRYHIAAGKIKRKRNKNEGALEVLQKILISEDDDLRVKAEELVAEYEITFSTSEQ
jgi:uncharacterized surface protein with fasciclin (FAS1) repeats